MLLIFIAAPIRLLAYKQLGQNFTFTLAKPKKLVKTGLYAYVRHPSYPTLMVCHLACYALLLRWGGLLGCWLPVWLVRWSSLELGLFLLFGVANLYGLLMRVGEEEDMLKSEYGEEYRVYASRTKKFVPWVI